MTLGSHKARLALALAILATRIPFAARYLYGWDAVQFSLALKKFDLAQQQPHPPGYIVYVWLGKLFFLFWRDENSAFVALSILASIAAAVCFYEICRLLFKNKNLALAASLVFAFNPVVWYYGEVASTYIFDSLFAVVFALLTLLIFRDKNPRLLILFALILGLSGGIRESLIVLFAPLFLLATIFLLVQKRLPVRAVIGAAAAGLAATTLWLAPLLYLTGSFRAYREVTVGQLGAVAAATSILSGAGWRLAKEQLVSVAKTTLAVCGVAPLLWILCLRRGRFDWPFKKIRLLVFALVWFAPSLFVYIFVHFGQPGYLMTLTPGILLAALIPLARFSEKPPRFAPWFLITLTVFEAAVFLLLPQPGPATGPLRRLTRGLEIFDYRVLYFTRSGLRTAEFEFEEYVKAAREFNPETTLILTETGFRYRLDDTETWADNLNPWFRQMEWYLPEYRTIQIAAGPVKQFSSVTRREPYDHEKSDRVALSPKITTVIIFTDGIDRAERAAAGIQRKGLPSKKYFYWIDLTDKKGFTYQGYEFKKQ